MKKRLANIYFYFYEPKVGKISRTIILKIKGKKVVM